MISAWVIPGVLVGVLWRILLMENRAGIANFGSFGTLTDNQLWCMGIDIDGESFLGQPFVFHDGGGNKCGCPFPPTQTCEAVSAGIAPPEQAESIP